MRTLNMRRRPIDVPDRDEWIAYLLQRRCAAARYVDVAGAACLQGLREGHALLDVPASIHPVAGGNAHADGLVGREGVAHRVEHFERKTHAVVQRPAIGVSARVGQRRQELVQQITVRGMHFDGVETQPGGASRGVRERVADACQTLFIERQRRVFARGMRLRRGRDRLPAALCGGNLRTAFPRSGH
jgi:hypothetical protein